MGPTWANLVPTWCQLGPTWGQLGPTWATFAEKLKTLIFDDSMVLFLYFLGLRGPSWSHLVTSWPYLGPSLSNLCQLVLKKTFCEFTLGQIGQLEPQDGSKRGVPEGSANQLFGCYVGSWGPSGPRWLQEPSRRPQELPKRPQDPQNHYFGRFSAPIFCCFCTYRPPPYM